MLGLQKHATYRHIHRKPSNRLPVVATNALEATNQTQGVGRGDTDLRWHTMD